jgi:hypothetical protein
MTKPSMFIGSSSEGLEAAQAIEFQLHQEADVTIWNEGFFGLGEGTSASTSSTVMCLNRQSRTEFYGWLCQSGCGKVSSRSGSAN